MQEILGEVKLKKGKNLQFESGAFIYDTLHSYNTKKPIYELIVSDPEIMDDQVDITIYTSKDGQIKQGKTQKLPRTKDNQKTLINSSQLEQYIDRTHQVVNLTKRKGRDFIEEAFSQGYQISGFYFGDWYIVVFDREFIQAGYNYKTGELVVSQNQKELSIINGKPAVI